MYLVHVAHEVIPDVTSLQKPTNKLRAQCALDESFQFERTKILQAMRLLKASQGLSLDMKAPKRMQETLQQ